jgi:phage terminase large subunit-like protein
MIRDVTTREKVDQYCDEILSGDVVACEMLIKAIEKYRQEMDRIGDADWPFDFDENAAHRSCLFFPMLLRHSLGEWCGQEFELSPWQLFTTWNLFGWKRKDGTRRFRRVFISVGRKNGKSTFCAGLAILLGAADGEPGAQVFIGATKIDQARIIYQEADRMLRQSPHIAKHATIFKDNIAFNATNSFIRPLGSDKPFDGLNPHAMFMDELHAWKDHHRGFFDTMSTGSGSRTQPMRVIITTAADEKGQIYHEEADYCRNVITGDIRDDSVFGLIFELDAKDDPFNPVFDVGTLKKANPNYGISVKQEYVQQQLTEAINKPQSRNRFLRYHGNRCISSVEDAISSELWDACCGELSDWSKADAIGAGIDVGGWDDLAAIAYVARFPVQDDDELLWRYEIQSVSFVSSDSRTDLKAEPYATWIAGGQLIVCDYTISEIRNRLVEDAELFGSQYFAYDPYNARQLAEDLEQHGLKPVKLPQNHGQYNELVNEYQKAMMEGRWRPDETDRVLRWCACNMAISRDNRDFQMPSKKHSKGKIDAAVAMLMALRACNQATPKCTGSLVL